MDALEPAAPREGRWFASPPTLRSFQSPRFEQLIGLLSLLATLSGSAVLLLATGKPLLTVFCGAFLYALTLSLGTATMAVMKRWDGRIGSGDRLFPDHELGDGEHPVQIIVFVEGEMIGGDRGVLLFEDGRLAFNGRATSFALAARDFVLVGDRDETDLYRGIPTDGLRLKVEDRLAYVRILPLAGHAAAVSEEVSEFLHRGEVETGSRQWPPIQSYFSQVQHEFYKSRLPEAAPRLE